MILKLFISLISYLLANNVFAEELVAQLSKDEVAITANFDGSEIFIYGAVKRDGPTKSNSPLEVLITVAGPEKPINVRRKSKRALIWVNTESIEIDSAPSFYAIASTGNLEEVINNTEDLRHKVSINRTIRSVGNYEKIKDAEDFTEALIRIRQKNNLYQELDNSISLIDNTLFATNIALPANLIEGDYKIRFFLIRDRKILDHLSTNIPVNKVGLERWIFDLSRKSPFIYALLSLFIAISSGWIASTVFRYIRV